VGVSCAENNVILINLDDLGMIKGSNETIGRIMDPGPPLTVMMFHMTIWQSCMALWAAIGADRSRNAGFGRNRGGVWKKHSPYIRSMHFWHRAPKNTLIKFLRVALIPILLWLWP